MLYPAVLVVAAVLMARHRRWDEAGGGGWLWFAAWCGAGALFTFSFLTGFSVGLFLLPLAAAALFVVASRAPGLEALGFVAGVGVIALVVVALNAAGTDLVPWLVAGAATLTAPVAAYAVSRRPRGR